MSTLSDSQGLLSLGNCLSFLMRAGLILDECLPRFCAANSWKETDDFILKWADEVLQRLVLRDERLR